MPFVKIVKINEKSAYAIWEITESIEELRGLAEKARNIQLPDSGVSNEIKQKEWLAGRLLLARLVEEMGNEYQGIYKDEFGKPHLKEYTQHISLSHSFPYVAAIFHQDKAVGIDIEQPKEKLLKISHKFLSEAEQQVCGNDVRRLCAFWCAKESMYKLYGKKRLIFKENLSVDFKTDGGSKILSGKVIVNGSTEEYNLQVENISDSMLVFTL